MNRAAKQSSKYLESAAKNEEYKGKEALKRVAGACIDGEKIFFLRYWPAELSYARPLGPKRQLSLFKTDIGEARGGAQILPLHCTSKFNC